jgi:outer membrane murein-binding lipoprotein Lpp
MYDPVKNIAKLRKAEDSVAGLANTEIKELNARVRQLETELTIARGAYVGAARDRDSERRENDRLRTLLGGQTK